MGFVDGGSLLVRIRCAFGANLAADPLTWTWTDVTAYWHVDDQVDLSWGGSSGASKLETSSLGLTLKNTDSRFTPYHPASPYWPHVREWVPIQYDIDLGDGVGWRNKFSGFVKNWAVRWPGASALMALTRIAAVGQLGRQERGKPPQRSPMRRSIGASNPVAYWACEDGQQAGWAASALPGHPPLTPSGTVGFTPVDKLNFVDPAFPTFLAGTQALVDLGAGGSLSVAVPAAVTAATATAWDVHILARVDPPPFDALTTLMEWTTPGGTFVRWRLVWSSFIPGQTQVIAYNAAGVGTVVINRPGLAVSLNIHDVGARQNGANINVGFLYSTSSGTYIQTGTIAGTLAGITSVTVNPDGFVSETDMPVGHLAIYDQYAVPYPVTADLDSYGVLVREARLSYQDEAAHDRLARLCAAEEGVSLTAPGVSADFVTRMGPQPVGTFLDLAQQCVDADQGLLREDGFGFGFVPREARYNQPVALTINAAAGQLGMPFEPVSDDPNRRNMWTVKREGGSSAVARNQALIDVQGEIEGSITVHHADDSLLDGHARWWLRRSTVQEPRYPALSVNLGAHPGLAADWCAAQRGSRIQVVNPPEQNVPGVVDQIVVGARETWRGRRIWKVTANVEPASPWQVGVYGTSRYDTEGSQLAAQYVAGTDTTLSVATTEGARWVTGAVDLDVNVGGVRVHVTNISGTSSPQTFTVTQTPVNGVVKTVPSGTAVSLFRPAVYAL